VNININGTRNQIVYHFYLYLALMGAGRVSGLLTPAHHRHQLAAHLELELELLFCKHEDKAKLWYNRATLQEKESIVTAINNISKN
jgi:hypothetical protein